MCIHSSMHTCIITDYYFVNIIMIRQVVNWVPFLAAGIISSAHLAECVHVLFGVFVHTHLP